MYFFLGFPLPESFEDGVKMKCSNATCKHQDQLIHAECFHALEDNLIKIMSNIGTYIVTIFHLISFLKNITFLVKTSAHLLPIQIFIASNGGWFKFVFSEAQVLVFGSE